MFNFNLEKIKSLTNRSFSVKESHSALGSTSSSNQAGSDSLHLVKALLFSLVVALIVSRIIFINPNTHIIGESGGDAYEYFGFMHVAKTNILEHLYPFSNSSVFRYPKGFNFGFGYDGGFAVLTGALLGLLVNQVLAYNLTVMLIVAVNMFVSIYAFEKIGLLLKNKHTSTRAYIAAVIFALSPYALARLSAHLNLAFIAGFPLLLFALINAWQKFVSYKNMNSKDYNYLGLSVLLCALGSLQYLILLVYIFVIVIALALIIPSFRKVAGFCFYLVHSDSNPTVSLTNHEEASEAASSPNVPKSDSKPYGNLQHALFKYGLIFLFFYGGYLYAFVSGGFNLLETATRSIPKLGFINLLVPNAYLGYWFSDFNHSMASIESVASLGFIEIVILGYSLYCLRKDKKGFLFASLILFVLISMMVFLPHIPLVPEMSRFIIFISLLMGFLVVSSLEVKSANILILLLYVLLLERGMFEVKTSELPNLAYTEMIRDGGGKAVLDIPISKYNNYDSLMPYFYGKSIYGGYFHHTAENDLAEVSISDNAPLQKFQCSDKYVYYDPSNEEFTETVNFLARYHTSYVVVHKSEDNGSKFLYPVCANVRSAWYLYNSPRLELSHANTDVKSHTFEVSLSQENIKTEIFLQKSGIFTLVGLYTNPVELDSLKVTFPDGSYVYPNLEKQEGGNRVEFDPVYTMEVKAGDFVTISSDAKINDNKYITVFYVYTPWVESDTPKQHLFQKVYEDDSVEVYKINYE